MKVNKIKMMVVIIMLCSFLSACSKMKNNILSSIRKETGQTTTDKKENWEKNISYRYKWAIANSNIQLLMECIEDGADINDVDGESPVFQAFISGNYAMATFLLDLGASPDWSNKDGVSILHLLTQSYTYNECKTLLDYGADVNYVDKSGRTEIEHAANNPMAGIDIFKLLIKSGAKVTPKALKEGLELNIRKCNEIQFLLKELKRTSVDSGLERILEYSILGETEKVRKLVKSEYKLLDSSEKENVLKFTGAYGSVATLKEIENFNINVEQQNWIISEAAIQNGNIDILKYCINNRMLDVNDPNRFPLTLAIAANQNEIVKYLIEQGANVNFEEYSVSNAREAAINGNTDILDLLLQNGYEVNLEKDIYNIVLDASINNKIGFLEFLESKGLLNKARNDDESPLDAAGSYSLDLVKYLISKDFDVNGFEDSGYPLYTSVENNNTNISLYLIENGADVNIFCDGTYLMKAVKNGNFDIVKALVEHGADINAQDYGFYPIVQSASGRTILKYLIEAGAEIDMQNIKSGKTALMVAVDSGNVEGVKILLEAGADKSIKNKNGQTAYDIAKDRNHVKCVELLADSESSQ